MEWDGVGGQADFELVAAPSTAPRTISTARATVCATSSGCLRSEIFPCSILETSRMSSIKRPMCCVCRSIMPRAQSRWTASSPCISRTHRALRMAPKGLRSSCPSRSRNSCSCRLASRRLAVGIGRLARLLLSLTSAQTQDRHAIVLSQDASSRPSLSLTGPLRWCGWKANQPVILLQSACRIED